MGAFLALALGGVGARAASAAPPPLVLLFPSDRNDASDSKALIALRTGLRKDGSLEVLSFDPDAPAMLLAASEAQHPEWLSAPLTGDPERLDIARAAGASFAVVVSHAGRGRFSLRVLEAGPAARTWAYPAEATSDAVKSVERAALGPTHALGEVNILPSPLPVVPNRLGVPSAPVPLPVLPPVTSILTTPAPAAPAATDNPNADRTAADLAAVQPLIVTADRDVQSGDFVDAYALYRQAINLAPLSDMPRLKLAQAYLQGGQAALALSEARRALEVVPDSPAIQAFLTQYDKENGTAVGKIARDQARAIKDPQDPIVHLDLGDALWNQGKGADAEAEFTRARDLAPSGSLNQDKAIAHLAGLHTSQGRYDDALAEMKASGDLGYPLVLSVVQNVMSGLAGDMDRAQGDYDAGKLTRADLYGQVQADETKAQALSVFVAKIRPPAAYTHSHLDRVEAVSLFAQAAAVLTEYLETNDQAQHDKAVQLEKDAQMEMLTAHAAEQKLGLWNVETRVGEGSP